MAICAPQLLDPQGAPAYESRVSLCNDFLNDYYLKTILIKN